MSGELAVSLVLKLNDQGSGAAARAMQTVTRAIKEIGEAAKSASSAAVTAFKKMADAREVLGIRSEKAIQNEIRQTEAAYQRLATSGQASARELGRAQDAMRGKVADLRRELEGVKQSAGGAGSALTKVGAIAAGFAAGKMVLQGPVSQAMNYSRELAHVSNTLYGNSSVAERIAAKQGINDAVTRARRIGGGTREQALAGLKALGASGEFGDDPKAAFAMLPTVVKAATATGSNVTDMANIAIKAKANMGLTNYERVFGMAAKGGIEGQFELNSMAKWLPQQMAYTQRTGLRGESGFATLIAMNQMAMRTAGTSDDAGNNVKNLLAKINSADTASDAKKLGIDLAGTLAAAQAKGVGGVDAFLNLAEQIAAKDKRLVQLRQQAKAASGDDLRENLQAQAGILEGSAIGKIIQDQQAMGALVAMLNGRGRFEEIRANVLGEKGTIGSLHEAIAAEPSYKAEQLAEEKTNSLQTALDKVNPLFGDLADHLVAGNREYPALSAAIAVTTLAVTALGAAAGAAAVGVALMSGGKVGIGALAGGALGGLARAPGAALGALGAFGPGAFAASMAFAGGYAGGSAINAGINKMDEKFGTTTGEDIGRLVAFLMAGLGNKDAERALNIEIQLDGEKVATAVNKRNAREATRH